MGDLTANFSRSEFACPCCGRTEMNRQHIERLQRFRDFMTDKIGRPIRIVCTHAQGGGFRCRAMNSKIKTASRNSQHCLGLATDIYSPDLNIRQLYLYAKEFTEFTGLGFYPHRNFIHVDSRKSAAVCWTM